MTPLTSAVVVVLAVLLLWQVWLSLKQQREIERLCAEKRMLEDRWLAAQKEAKDAE
jgi:hypothetical protein